MARKNFNHNHYSIFTRYKNWQLNTSFTEKLAVLKNQLLNSSWKLRMTILIIILGLGFLTRYLILNSQVPKIKYETATAEKGTLITSISGSGTVTSGNYTNVTTKTSGVVNKVYVTNGDTVTKGQKIAEVELDDYAKE